MYLYITYLFIYLSISFLWQHTVKWSTNKQQSSEWECLVSNSGSRSSSSYNYWTKSLRTGEKQRRQREKKEKTATKPQRLKARKSKVCMIKKNCISSNSYILKETGFHVLKQTLILKKTMNNIQTRRHPNVYYIKTQFCWRKFLGAYDSDPRRMWWSKDFSIIGSMSICFGAQWSGTGLWWVSWALAITWSYILSQGESVDRWLLRPWPWHDPDQIPDMDIPTGSWLRRVEVFVTVRSYPVLKLLVKKKCS